jgi:hypothetical protein
MCVRAPRAIAIDAPSRSTMLSINRYSLLVTLPALILVVACDSGPGCSHDSECKGARICQAGACVEPSSAPVASPAAPSPAAGAPAAAAPTTAVTAAAPATTAAATTPAADMGCDALVEHIVATIRRTGSARRNAVLPAAAEIRGECEKKTRDPTALRCVAAATDVEGFDTCSRQAFPGSVDATPTRRFHALQNNRAADPPVLTRDGDYLAWDDDCGMLYKEAYPAGAIFVVCKGRVEIGPLVNIEELDRVNKSLAAQEDQRHKMVVGLISKAAIGDFRVPVHVYDSNGAYRGIEYR